MKKILVLCALALTLLTLSSCTKGNSLIGTEWIYDSFTLSFVSATNAEYRGQVNSMTIVIDYAYIKNGDTVTFYPKDDEMAILEGVINGDRMTLRNTSQEKTIGVFVRK